MQYLPQVVKPTLVMGSNALLAFGYEKIKILQKYIEYEIPD